MPSWNRRRQTIADWLKTGLWAAILTPLGVVAHEAAHYFGYLAYDLPEPRLGYADGGFAGMRTFWEALGAGNRAAAAEIAPIFDVGMTALFGVAFTLLIGLIGLYLLLRRASLFGGALAVAALCRNFFITIAYVSRGGVGTDESNIELTLAIPGLALALLGLAMLFVALWGIWKRSGWRSLFGVIAGVSIGLAAWMGIVGPLVFPS